MKILLYSLYVFCLLNLLGCGSGSDSPVQSPISNNPVLIFGVDKKFEPTQWSGDFRVASTQYHWVDDSREEPHTQDNNDKREVLVRIFYPTDADYTDNRLSVMNDRRWQYMKDQEFLANKRLRESNYANVKWFVELDSKVSLLNSQYPLLIFSHGYGLSPELHVNLAAELASRGYIVASINHPYGSEFTEFPDGRVIGFQPLPDSNLGRDLPLWSDDQIFVLDKLIELNLSNDSLFSSKINLAHIGAFGHSYGGAASYYSAFKDARFKAVINMDGTIFNSDNKNIVQPFMLVQVNNGHQLEIFEQVASDGYAVLFENRVTHLVFTDYSLFWAWDFPDENAFGPLNSETALSTTHQLNEQFFAKYFYGNPAPMLDDPAMQPANVKIIKY